MFLNKHDLCVYSLNMGTYVSRNTLQYPVFGINCAVSWNKSCPFVTHYTEGVKCIMYNV